PSAPGPGPTAGRSWIMTAPWWAHRRSISATMRAMSAPAASEGAPSGVEPTGAPSRSQITTEGCAGATGRPVVRRRAAGAGRRAERRGGHRIALQVAGHDGEVRGVRVQADGPAGVGRGPQDGGGLAGPGDPLPRGLDEALEQQPTGDQRDRLPGEAARAHHL